ncbi:DUF1642 domain-containing protein [Lentilactobacillus parabuchneri]|uniref:DUF1642 domain-containing protein n=1 Tax=Lentilactobacillus parabuchneri TaxID=152331 RepID=UPI0021A7D72C|nr:DUF1642 domain-containing protein [Lentilactobacillus parabuchneri]
MIKTYRKTATIKAEQFDGSKRMAKRYGAELYSESGYGYAVVEGEPDGDGYVIDTPEGELLLRTGDWIATGVNGEHWPISDDVFRKTYSELPVIPRVWADTIEEYKANHYRLSEIFTEWDCSYGWQELIARAWLDGYQVEENK